VLGEALTAHTGIVWSVTLSADGRTLATAGHDGTIVLWDVSDRERPVRLGDPLVGHNRTSVYSVAFDARRPTILISGGGDGRTVLWDLADRSQPRLVAAVGAQRGIVRQIALLYAADVTNVASASSDRTVLLTDITDLGAPGGSSEQFAGHTSAVNAVAISPDARTMATAGDDTTAVVWRLDEPGYLGYVVAGFPAPSAAVSPVVFGPDDATLLGGSPDGAVPLWDVVRNQAAPMPEVLSSDPTALTASAFSANRRVLAIARPDGSLALWDVADPWRSHELWRGAGGHPAPINGLAISADARTMATISTDGLVQLWDTSDPRRPTVVSQVKVDGQPSAVAIAPDGATLMVGTWDGAIVAFDLAAPGHFTPLGRKSREHGTRVSSITFSPDGRAALTTGDSKVLMWDLSDRTQLRQIGLPLIEHLFGASAATFSADGSYLYTAGGDRRVLLWDVADRSRPELLATLLTTQNQPRSLALGLSGTMLAIGAEPGSVQFVGLADVDALRHRALDDACRRAGNLDDVQWSSYVPRIPYQDSCS
jgi:WD40 repeat protein